MTLMYYNMCVNKIYSYCKNASMYKDGYFKIAGYMPLYNEKFPLSVKLT